MEAGLGVDGVIVNRMQPAFGTTEPVLPPDASSELQALLTNRNAFAALANSEHLQLDGLKAAARGAAMAFVPCLPDDVHDLAGLELVRGYL